MKPWLLFRGMVGIQLTAWVQRAMRLLLRAAWLFAGLNLAGHSLEKISGQSLAPSAYLVSFFCGWSDYPGGDLFPVAEVSRDGLENRSAHGA